MDIVNKSFVADRHRIKVIAFIVLIFPNFISPLTHYLKGFQFFFSNFHGAFDLKTLFLFKKFRLIQTWPLPNISICNEFSISNEFHAKTNGGW